MATYESFYKQYAQRIRTAIKQDGFSVYSPINIARLRNSYTLSELKKIKAEIDELVYENDRNKLLSTEDKGRIYQGLSEELNLPSLQSSILLCKSASNDELTDLVRLIDTILRGGK